MLVVCITLHTARRETMTIIILNVNLPTLANVVLFLATLSALALLIVDDAHSIQQRVNAKKVNKTLVFVILKC